MELWYMKRLKQKCIRNAYSSNRNLREFLKTHKLQQICKLTVDPKKHIILNYILLEHYPNTVWGQGRFTVVSMQDT